MMEDNRQDEFIVFEDIQASVPESDVDNRSWVRITRPFDGRAAQSKNTHGIDAPAICEIDVLESTLNADYSREQRPAPRD